MTGPRGAAGPAGKIELITCTVSTVKGKSVRKCTGKLVSGTVKFTTTGGLVHATLSRGHVVFATGTAKIERGVPRLRLSPRRALRPGRYTVTFESLRRGHVVVTRQTLMVR